MYSDYYLGYEDYYRLVFCAYKVIAPTPMTRLENTFAYLHRSHIVGA